MPQCFSTIIRLLGQKYAAEKKRNEEIMINLKAVTKEGLREKNYHDKIKNLEKALTAQVRDNVCVYSFVI